MKTGKKILTVALSAMVCASSVIGAVGCKKDNVIVDGKTINVKAYKSGNGVEWLYELASKFETIYKDEGYKVNILEPSNDMIGDVVLTDMALGTEETGIDLYITSGVGPNKVSASGDYGVLAEDIEETVFNKAPIGYDGQEEDVLISEKLESRREKYSRSDDGIMYAFQYTGAVAGLSVNVKKLEKYGLEIPRTTNELLDCIEKIYLGVNGMENSEESDIFPMTYVSGTNGYVVTALDSFMAQYNRKEYDQFWSMQNTVGGVLTDMIDNGYEVYNLPCVEEMMTLAHVFMDQRLATRGSTTQNLDQAQAKLMQPNEGAVFMFNGSWMLNEVRLNYKNYVNDVTFAKMPLISSLGSRLMGSGTAYNLDEEKCDDILSYIAGMVDENAEISDVVAAVTNEFGVTLGTEVVEEIATARGAVYQRGIEEVCYINKNAAAKVPTELFLRMMASDDFAQTWLDCAYSTTAYATDMDLSNVPYQFVKDAAKINTNKYANTIAAARDVKGLRKQLGLTSIFSSIAHIPSEITMRDIISMYDGKGGKISGASMQTYRNAAKKLIGEEIQYWTKNNSQRWKDELSELGN